MTDFKFTSGKEPYLTKTSLAYMYSRLNNVSELFTTQNLFGGVVYHYPTLYEYTYTHIQYLDSRFKWFLFQPAMLIPGVGRPVSETRSSPKNDVFWSKRYFSWPENGPIIPKIGKISRLQKSSSSSEDLKRGSSCVKTGIHWDVCLNFH